MANKKVTEEPKKEKNSAELNSLIRSLNKKFGENAITLGFPNTKDGEKSIERIPTGSFSLDVSLGGGKRLPSVIVI